MTGVWDSPQPSRDSYVPTELQGRRPLSGWLIFGDQSREVGQTLILTLSQVGVRGTRLCAHRLPWWRVYHPSGMFGLLRKAYELLITDPQWVTWHSDHPTAFWSRSFDQWLKVEFPKSTLIFDLGIRVLWSPQKDYGSRWIIDKVKMKNGRTAVCDELRTLFPFFSASHSLFSSFAIIPMALWFVNKLVPNAPKTYLIP